ncbi:MAG: hypothetical protein NT075_25765 [Chloroflexi bacterium]|nr:hypothetical protein [Chloroflexota bacterium]
MHLNTLLIAPGETATLTITVQRTVDGGDLNLDLTLPTGLVTAQGQSALLHWIVPAEPDGQAFEQQVQIQAAPDLLATDHATLSIEARISAAGRVSRRTHQSMPTASFCH